MPRSRRCGPRAGSQRCAAPRRAPCPESESSSSTLVWPSISESRKPALAGRLYFSTCVGRCGRAGPSRAAPRAAVDVAGRRAREVDEGLTVERGAVDVAASSSSSPAAGLAARAGGASRPCLESALAVRRRAGRLRLAPPSQEVARHGVRGSRQHPPAARSLLTCRGVHASGDHSLSPAARASGPAPVELVLLDILDPPTSVPVALTVIDCSLAGREVARRDADDAVGVDVEGDLDLGLALRRAADAGQHELAEQVVLGRARRSRPAARGSSPPSGCRAWW